jgi:hypothetical protein
VTRRRLARHLVVGVVVLMGLSGCTDHATTAQPGTNTPTTKASGGRDPQRSVDTLRRLDMCAVLQVAVGTGREVRANRPSQCATFDSGPEVQVSVARMPADERTSPDAQDVGGAKAYLLDGSGDCTVSLPVNADLVIEFLGADSCAEVRPMVAEAAGALRDPAALEGEPRWEACAALREVQDVHAGGIENLDLCADTTTLATLDFAYSTPGVVPAKGWRRSTVDGVEISTLDDRDPDAPSCTSEWSLGTARSDHADGEFVARVRAIDCSKVTPLVGSLVAVLKREPDAGDPQQPLLYAPDEPDHP